jgi:hypothetical protein
MSNFGEDFAKENGYTVYSHSFTKVVKSVIYSKQIGGNSIYLEVKESGVANLSRVIGGLIECKVGDFGIPNDNFKLFEKAIAAIR